MSNKKIIMTGGGTAGHVTPNIALMPRLKELGYEIQYIGTENGIERKLIEEKKIKYHTISSGKLRRYFDVKNFTDPFKVIKGVFDAKAILKKERPNIVFSKGGFVSVPVVLGAYFNRIPIIIHESDITPGLANKIAMPYATKICVTFKEAMEHVNKKKAVLTGSPIREELFSGSKIKAREFCGFKDKKPVILVTGGSLGSRILNECVRESLKDLLEKFNVIHLCGKGNLNRNFNKTEGYVQYEYIKDELSDLMNLADIVISRAGSNTIFELLALKKPNILIPLSAKASRGDQILNAKAFEKSGYSVVIEEENLNALELLEKVEALNANKEIYISKMSNSTQRDSISNIITLIEEYSNK
ncbi:MAG: undecaprenyldiphospho-muramoylpentapeptide beta-N-acetylglucosaminyltransferase [Clostridium sp.]|uniref:undecaprenyldiphospho-muramoylpentapeptide beta-N-acetylglucosaminyltransferase n=1 Tax=Clostridium sp. TaxID=1506 RepID=UPI0030400DAF